MVKNYYPLLLISKTLDRFNRSKVFIKLNFKNTYYYIQIKKGDE